MSCAFRGIYLPLPHVSSLLNIASHHAQPDAVKIRLRLALQPVGDLEA